MASVELFILIDEDGEFVISKDRDTLEEKWDEEIGDRPILSRTLCIKLEVALPKEVIVTATIPEGKTAVNMTVTG